MNGPPQQFDCELNKCRRPALKRRDVRVNSKNALNFWDDTRGRMELIDGNSDLATVEETARVLHVPTCWVDGRRLQRGTCEPIAKNALNFWGDTWGTYGIN
jgi:hypothetical protein